MSFFIIIGKIIGYISLVFPRKLSWPIYRIKRGYITARLKGGIKHIGRGTLLAQGVKIYRGEHLAIGAHSSIMSHCIIETSPADGKAPILEIGDNVSIGEYSHITCANKITIGNGVLTGRFVLITDNAHGKCTNEDSDIAPLQRNIYSKGEVIINENVWIGDKATILPGVTIGKGAVIAANAVVTKDVPDYTIVAGVPAKIVKRIK